MNHGAFRTTKHCVHRRSPRISIFSEILLLCYLCKNIGYNFTRMAMFYLKHLYNKTLCVSMMNRDIQHIRSRHSTYFFHNKKNQNEKNLNHFYLTFWHVSFSKTFFLYIFLQLKNKIITSATNYDTLNCSILSTIWFLIQYMPLTLPVTYNARK